MEDPGREIVVSVPHSGTRTLCTHLDLVEDRKYNYIHWGQNDADIATLTGRVHVPIRNPIDIARTWDGRYRTSSPEGSHSIENMLWRMDRMLDFICVYHDRTLWKVEEIDLRVGKGEERAVEESERVIATRKWLSDKMWFYDQYYEFD